MYFCFVKTYRLKSGAKINLGLRVLSKRKDGFHNIETIFYPVKLFDKITIDLGSSSKNGNAVKHVIKVKTKGLKGLNGAENICFKAAKLFLKNFCEDRQCVVTIIIEKNIPIGAGLGGGSSDAASVLLYLARHFKISTSQRKKLLSIALLLGSDVPFFLSPQPAYALGRGEKLKALREFRITGKILIVNPNINISTPWAYKQLGMRAGSKIRPKKFDAISAFNYTSMKNLTNDFEKVVFKKYPEVENIKHLMLISGAEFAMMSGSGSTVYGIYKKAADLSPAAEFFAKKKYLVFTS